MSIIVKKDWRTISELSSTTAPSGASLIGIEDAGGYFTGTDVEAALQELGAGGGGAGTLQEAYEGGNTITTDGVNGSVIIDNSTGGQELQIIGSSSQQVFEIYDSVAEAGTIIGYTDGSMDFFPSDNANYGIYIAPSSESAAHIRLEPLATPPASLAEGDIFLEGAAVDRLKVYANATTNTVAWLSDVTGMTNPMTTGGDIIYGGASGTPTRLANGTAGQVLQSNGTTLAPSWVAAGTGDMVLASAQTVTGAKTFNDTKLLMRNVADTYNGSFTNTNTANRVYTLQDKAGVVGLVVPRIISATSYTTSTTIDASITDVYAITAQAGALLFNNPTGSPQDGQGLVIRIKDNGTARALTYGTEFRGVVGALPSTTVISKILYMAFMYNSAETKWDLIGKSQEA